MELRHRGAYDAYGPGLVALGPSHAKLYYAKPGITFAPAEERALNREAVFGAYATARDLGDITDPIWRSLMCTRP